MGDTEEDRDFALDVVNEGSLLSFHLLLHSLLTVIQSMIEVFSKVSSSKST